MNKHQLRDLIERVLREADMYSVEATELLMMTAAVESRLGHYIRQVEGPALGIFQMEPATHDDIWKNYLVYKSHDFPGLLAADKFGCEEQHSSDLEYNLAYAIVMARLHYRRVPSALPPAHYLYFANDKRKPHPLWIEGMAEYWKQFYNTPKGKGTVEKAVRSYNKYCL